VGICQVQQTFKSQLKLEVDFPTDGRQFDAFSKPGDRFPLGELHVGVIATPGHTSDSVT